MANTTKIVVARVHPKPGRLQEVIDVYAGIVGLVYQEPGCEQFALHTDGETVFVVERWATPADLQGHAAGPAYAQIRAGISNLVDHAADVWVLDPLLFGEMAEGTVGAAPDAVTSRHAETRHRGVQMGIRDTLVNGPLGFGSAPLGNMFRDIPDHEPEATVDAAWDHGTRYLDTAPMRKGLGDGVREDSFPEDPSTWSQASPHMVVC